MNTTDAARCPFRDLDAQFDPIDAERMYDFSAKARPETPSFYNEQLDVWVVTRYDEIHHIMRDTDTFSASAVHPASITTRPASGVSGLTRSSVGVLAEHVAPRDRARPRDVGPDAEPGRWGPAGLTRVMPARAKEETCTRTTVAHDCP